jgi:hypothetical protein
MAGSLVEDVTNDLPFVYQSRSYTLRLTIKDKATGDPIDLTGSTFASQLRRYRSSTDVAAAFTFDLTNAATGVVVMSLSPAQTAALAPGPYRWDVDQLVAGVPNPLAQGELIVEGDVTR